MFLYGNDTIKKTTSNEKWRLKLYPFVSLFLNFQQQLTHSLYYGVNIKSNQDPYIGLFVTLFLLQLLSKTQVK